MFTIGKLAEAAGVNVETVRYYERRGLLEQPDRPWKGYRQYSDADLWRLQFIQRGKALGFTLAELTDLLRGRSAEQILDATRRKLDAVEQQRQDLDRRGSRLRQLATLCETGSDDCVALRVSS